MTKTLTLRLGEPVCRLFKDVADRENRPISNFIEAAVMRFVREHENEEYGPRAAVFLDRDGTIIEDRGDLFEPSQVVFFKDTVSSLCRLCERYRLVIVTNQSGVAKGAISMPDVERVNSHITSYLARHGVPILATYVCPHERTAGCHCIKPNPYFLKKAESDFGIDLRRSFVIGDHPHDVELAASVGATGIYVLSGHGMKHRGEVSGHAVVTGGIGEAAEHILERALHTER